MAATLFSVKFVKKIDLNILLIQKKKISSKKYKNVRSNSKRQDLAPVITNRHFLLTENTCRQESL